MNGPEKLLETENQWVTRMGAWFSGERVVFRGQDLHVDLKEMSWMELYLYGITGRRFNEKQLKVFTAMWTYTSFPEPRLWNNRIAALAGTVRSTASLALGVATSVSEASIYGHRPNIQAIDFLLRTKKAIDNGADLLSCIKTELRERRIIYGYGRPVHRTDERNQHFLKLVQEMGMDQGPYLLLALEVDKLLLNGRWRMQINITGLDAALSADMGLNPREHHLFMTTCFLAGMPPCFIDAYNKPEGTFFPLRCTRIQYEGKNRRTWGRNEELKSILESR